MPAELPPSIAFMLDEFRRKEFALADVRKRLNDRAFVKDYFDQCSASITTYKYADELEARPDKFDIYAGAGLDPLTFRGKGPELQRVIDSAHSFARTACLYADRVVIPDPFSFTVEATDEEIFRSLLVLKVLKPLIEAGVVIFGAGAYVSCGNCSKVINNAKKHLAAELWKQFSKAAPDVFRYKDGRRWRISFGSPLLNRQRISFPATKEAVAATTRPNKLLTGKNAMALVREYREALKTHFAHSAHTVVMDSFAGSRCNATVVTNTPEEAVGYRLLDHRKAGVTRPDWSLLRTVQLPLLQTLNATQAMRVRKEAEKALPAFRAKLQLDLMSLKDLSDEAEEKRALEIATELRLAARELEGELASISLPSLRKRERLFIGLAFALEIVALGSGNPSAIFAASGTFASAMIAAHQTERDRKERHEALIHQPAYVLLSAERIHKATY